MNFLLFLKDAIATLHDVSSPLWIASSSSMSSFRVLGKPLGLGCSVSGGGSSVFLLGFSLSGFSNASLRLSFRSANICCGVLTIFLPAHHFVYPYGRKRGSTAFGNGVITVNAQFFAYINSPFAVYGMMDTYLRQRRVHRPLYLRRCARHFCLYAVKDFTDVQSFRLTGDPASHTVATQ